MEGGARPPRLKPVQVTLLGWNVAEGGKEGIVGGPTTQKGVVRLISPRVGSR